MKMMGLALNLICIVQTNAVIEKHIWHLMNAVDVAGCHPFYRIDSLQFRVEAHLGEPLWAGLDGDKMA